MRNNFSVVYHFDRLYFCTGHFWARKMCKLNPKMKNLSDPLRCSDTDHRPWLKIIYIKLYDYYRTVGGKKSLNCGFKCLRRVTLQCTSYRGRDVCSEHARFRLLSPPTGKKMAASVCRFGGAVGQALAKARSVSTSCV